MIFVTVGTHEQPFDRLLLEVDRLVKSGFIDEETFIQRGMGSITPLNCPSSELLGYREMEARFDEARIIITHGGPGSIMSTLSRGKVPIVVPRQAGYDEHVDDHQVAFTKYLEDKGRIIAVYDIETLGRRISDHDILSSGVETTQNQGKVESFYALIEKLDNYCEEVSR